MIKLQNIKVYLLASFTCLIAASCNNSLTREDNEQGIYYDLEYSLLPAPANGSVPDSILALYDIDAKRLTVRMMHDLGGEAAEEIELPRDFTTSLINGLSAIYAATHLAARDTVIELFQIHTFLYPQLYELIVSADSSRSFMQAWAAGNRLTDNSEIDQLMQAYDLQLKSYNASSSLQYAVLNSGRALNITALASRFEALPDVVFAETNGYCCDGPDIAVELSDMIWMFTYWLKWGDCPSGCILRHGWSFEVDPNGTVTFLGSTGNDLANR